MSETIKTKRHLPVALLLVAALSAAACAKKPKEAANGGELGLQTPASTATPGSPPDFVVNVGDRVLFTTDSSSVDAEAQEILDRQAQWLNQYGQYSITVEGHADERGTREYNLALGARRATAVKRYLSSRGIAADRIDTISFGKERPVATCNDISCWSQNRRGVTVLDSAAGS